MKAGYDGEADYGRVIRLAVGDFSNLEVMVGVFMQAETRSMASQETRSCRKWTESVPKWKYGGWIRTLCFGIVVCVGDWGHLLSATTTIPDPHLPLLLPLFSRFLLAAP